MNDLIRKLAEQCTTQYQDGNGGYIDQVDTEKFAELIVRECAEAVKNSIWHLPRGYKVADQAEFVKKHFGVEE